jgi:hypothetical protein
MEKKTPQKPFFARFLESQELVRASGARHRPVHTTKHTDVVTTLKYPSDDDEYVTLKYPSDGDDDVIL